MADVVSAVLPFVPAVGAVRHAGKIKKIFSGADKATDAAKTATKGETAATKAGREVHTAFKKKVEAKEGWRSEPRLDDPATGKTVIPDAVSPSGKPVELKPNTPTGRKTGKAQLEKYEGVLGKKGRVVYYDPQ